MEETQSSLSQSAGLIIAALVALVAVLGSYYWYTHRGSAAPPAPVESAPPHPVAAPPVAAAKPSPYKYPIDDTASDHSTALDQSDAKIIEALSKVTGWPAGALNLLVRTNLIRHIVATVDALPRDKLPLQSLPTHSVPGMFGVATSEQGSFISAANALRYRAYIEAFTSPETTQVAAVYRHFYPLFQQAYRELGYPNGNFNDRLVEVIDEMVEAPEPKAPIAVVAPRAMYHYVDGELEGLSAGQKVLVRIGAANENAVKGKLRELRAAITTAP